MSNFYLKIAPKGTAMVEGVDISGQYVLYENGQPELRWETWSEFDKWCEEMGDKLPNIPLPTGRNIMPWTHSSNDDEYHNLGDLNDLI